MCAWLQGTYSTQIFSLAVLLSSMFVYNQVYISSFSSPFCLGFCGCVGYECSSNYEPSLWLLCLFLATINYCADSNSLENMQWNLVFWQFESHLSSFLSSPDVPGHVPSERTNKMKTVYSAFCLEPACLPSCDRFWHLFDHWYLQMGGIDEAALDKLSLVTEMTKHIRVRASSPSQTHSSASEIGQFSPFFLWLLRVCDSPNLLMVWSTSVLDLHSNNNMLQVCIVWWFAQCIAIHSWPFSSSAAMLVLC